MSYSLIQYNHIRPDLRLREKGTVDRVKGSSPVGTYDGFPEIIHGFGRYQSHLSIQELKKLIFVLMSDLNERRLTYPMSVVNREGVFEGEISFEIGIAEGNWFNYLDSSELKRLKDTMLDSSLPLDFLMILRYKYQRSGRNASLRSDHYLVRYLFREGEFDILLSHDRGIRRYQMDELLNLLDSMIRQKSAERRRRTKRVEMRAL